MFDACAALYRLEGRIVVIGFASGTVPQIPANILLVKNVAVLGFYWGSYRRRDPERMRAGFRQLFDWCRDGTIRPGISEIVPLAERQPRSSACVGARRRQWWSMSATEGSARSPSASLAGMRQEGTDALGTRGSGDARRRPRIIDAKVAATAGSPYTRRDDPLTMDRQKTIRECAMCPTSGGRRTASGDLSSDGRARWHLVSVAALCVALAACGGGGGGGGGSGGTPGPVSTPDPISPTPRPPSVPVSAAETSANHGIAQIGADVAYAAGATGRGVKVAVIDSGISLDHPEFVGRIDRQNSLDIVTGTAATLEDRSGHGSHVAGIIAANVDGVGMRGVAPSATLLAIRADLRDSTICGTPGCGYFDSDVAAALDYARAQNVDIVNLSIGKDGALSAPYRSALEKVIASGALVVVAAGNQGNDEPLSPARLADASGIRGGMLVAGAVDRNNAAYALNNKAGSVAQYFLVAPGVDVFSASRDGGYGRLTGTSMAAPHVAGAAAVLKSAFPSLTMQQVAELLTSTADDLGPRGVDQTFGTGLLNLERALQPVGRQQVAVGDDVEGHRVSVQSSQLALGSAFGDALSGETSLARTMVLDAYDRPYVADFRKLIRPRSSGGMTLGHKLRDGMHYRDVQLEALAPLGLDARLAFSESADRPIEGSARAALAGGPHEGENLFERLSVGGIDLPVGSASIGMGLAASEVGATPSHVAASGLFIDAGSLLAPTDAVVARGTGGTLKVALTEDTVMSLGLMDSDGLAASNGSASPGRLVALGCRASARSHHRPASELRLCRRDREPAGQRRVGGFRLRGRCEDASRHRPSRASPDQHGRVVRPGDPRHEWPGERWRAAA
jgi:hypothetical protein